MRDKKLFLHSIAGVGLLALCSTFSGCGLLNPDPTDEFGGMEVRTYEVPEEYQDDLRVMLQSALEPVGDNPNPMGRVINGPGSTLLVTAPARLQAGIEQVLSRDLDARPISRPVTLSYWFLVGRPRDSSQPPQPFSVVGRSIPQLEPVLTQIANAEGSTEFSLLEMVQLTSMNLASANTSGRFFFVDQQATRSGEQVVVYVDIQGWHGSFPETFMPPEFETRVTLEAGQFLVLGRTGLVNPPADAFPDTRGGNDVTLYYVMTAES